MKNSKKMIEDFLEQVKADQELKQEKLGDLKAQKQVVDGERSEIAKAIVRFEATGDEEAVKQLNKELKDRIVALELLDTKIAAYEELGSNYQSEALRIVGTAAKEYMEECPKVDKKHIAALTKKREEVKKLQESLREKEKEEKELGFELDRIRGSHKAVITGDLSPIIDYLPEEVKSMFPKKDNRYYEMEDSIRVYYEEHIRQEGNENIVTEKKSFIDKLLKR